MLTFDADAHQYFWDGKPVPNVTRILEPLTDYSMIAADKLETARQKGIAVHKMVELWAKDDLDENTLPDWMRPVLEQWKRFVDETGFEVSVSEYRVFHPTYRYAGTLDLFGRMKHAGHVAFVDIKRSFLAGPVIGMQLAAYQDAYCEQEKVGKNARRYALRLNETGPYRLEPFDSKRDFQDFLTLLAFYNLKQRISQ